MFIRTTKWLPVCLKMFSTNPGLINSSLLTDRGLIMLSGKNSVDILQGLCTVDVSELYKDGMSGPLPGTSLYTMMLNPAGRVLFDAILHRRLQKEDKTSSIIIDCEHTQLSDIMAHLNRYKLRKKVFIEDISSEFHVLSLWLNHTNKESRGADLIDINSTVPLADVLTISLDPRCALLGQRAIISRTSSPIVTSPPDLYTQQRFTLGIPEGAAEVQKGKALPLNYNGDLMNGISFSKGCYLGQELTARTYHTGIIRRRIVPISLSKPLPDTRGAVVSEEVSTTQPKSVEKTPLPIVSQEQADNSSTRGPITSYSSLQIYDSTSGTKEGNLIATQGTAGLAMLRLTALHGPHNKPVHLSVLSDTIVRPYKPTWWPATI